MKAVSGLTGHNLPFRYRVFNDSCAGGRVHVGDMANLVYSSAIDSESAVTATVKLEDHALIGAAAVAMPGTTLGKGSTLGAMAASLPGAQLPGEAAPATVGLLYPSTTLQRAGRDWP